MLPRDRGKSLASTGGGEGRGFRRDFICFYKARRRFRP